MRMRVSLIWDHRSFLRTECDMRSLALFNEHEFDVVLDKAAMDALCVDEGDVWDPQESCRRDVHQTCRAIHRVLKRDGLFIQISFAQPHFRRRYLERPQHYGWSFAVHTFGTGFGYFFYTMRKDAAVELGADEMLPARAEHSAARGGDGGASAPTTGADTADDCGPLGIDL